MGSTFWGEARSRTGDAYLYEASWSIDAKVSWSAVVFHDGVSIAQPIGEISLVIIELAGGIRSLVRTRVEAAIFGLEDQAPRRHASGTPIAAIRIRQEESEDGTDLGLGRG